MTILYMFQAALYCEDCGERLRADLDKQGKTPADPEDERMYDSDNYPKECLGAHRRLWVHTPSRALHMDGDLDCWFHLREREIIFALRPLGRTWSQIESLAGGEGRR